MLPRLLARSWPGLLLQVPSFSSLLKGVYNPKAFIPHAALLRQAFAHCAIFPTAASRRSLGRVSVPVWLIVLSDQLPVDALVGRYPNQLADRPRGPPGAPEHFLGWPCDHPGVSGISQGFPWLSRSPGQVPHVLLTRSPLDNGPKAAASFDLHVLSTPPAFVLSQDQTLRRDLRHRPRPGLRSGCSAAPRRSGCVSSFAGQRAGLAAWGGRPGSPGAEAPGGPAVTPDHVLTDIASSHAARADARTRYASVSSVFKKQSASTPIADRIEPDRRHRRHCNPGRVPKGPARGEPSH